MVSLLDIIGPVMVGPSSSHTAGACRLGLLARCLVGGTPQSGVLQLHGSFARTGEGHGTDKALVGGLLGFRPDDERLRDALQIAEREGLDYKFDYDTLRRACSAVRRGAHFIATNTDATIPVEGGEIWPGAGSLAAALQTCSGVAPMVIGKPNVAMATMALEELKLPADRVLCVGDRLETDIAMGVAAGMKTALVLTGVSRREEIARSGITPDYVFEAIPDLMAGLGIT